MKIGNELLDLSIPIICSLEETSRVASLSDLLCDMTSFLFHYSSVVQSTDLFFLEFLISMLVELF